MSIQNIYLALRKRIILALRGRYFVVERRRLRFLLDAHAYIDRRIEAYGVYEAQQLKFFGNQLKQFKPSLFIDVGANSGLYTITLGAQIPGLEVIAFEPDERNRAQFSANLFLNGMNDFVTIMPFALSKHSGVARFHRHDRENPGRSMIAINGEYEVEIRKLDEVINRVADKIALKIDIEGHELPMLIGSEAVLRNNDCLIQLESFAPARVIEYLESLGYLNFHQLGNDLYFRREG